ncbi:hypothetical protein ACIQUQ_16780 [Streptomyces sp. NPDC101118]|uniref:hypothetical protein n=1 Tax=unclassified Streptomyces TaxID=2593676 RepID=UPI0037CDF592
MARIPTAAVTAGGLVGGYAVARWTRKRPLGGAVLAAAGAVAAREWQRYAGVPAAAALGGLYVAGFAGSHPLAKKIGAWPAVLAAAGVVSTAAWLVSDRLPSGDEDWSCEKPEEL